MKKLLKAGLISLMMVGSLASCTDGVSGTTVATGQGSTTPSATPTQPKEDGKMTVEEAKTYADAHYSQDKVAEKYNQGETVINYDLKKCEGLILTQLGLKVGVGSTTQTLKEEDLVVLTSKDIDSMAKAIDSYEGKDKAELNFSMTENIMKIEFDFPASILTAALEKLLTEIQNSDCTGTGDTNTPVITFEDFVGSGAGMSGYITVNELGLASGVDATIDYTLTFNYVYESTLPNGTTTNTKVPDTESIIGDATAAITYSMGETTKEA